MNRKNLQEAIIPTKLNNQIPGLEYDERLNTEDLVYIQSSAEVGEKVLVKAIMDFAKFCEDGDTEKTTVPVQVLRDIYVSEDETFIHFPILESNGNVKVYDYEPEDEEENEQLSSSYFSPCMRLDIDKYFELTGLSAKSFCTTKKIGGKTVHTLPFGEFPQTLVDEKTRKKLLEKKYEVMPAVFHDLNVWFEDKLKIHPYIKIDNQEYLLYFNPIERTVDNKTFITYEKMLFKVEPVEYVIKNWDRLPKEINPNGTGEDKFFDVSSEKLFSYRQFSDGIPYHVEENYNWKDTGIRSVLNGVSKELFATLDEYDQKSANEAKGQTFIGATINNPEALNEYVFTKEELDLEYLNSLPVKKFILKQPVKSIKVRQNELINFPYIYFNQENQLVFSKEMPQKGEYKETASFSEHFILNSPICKNLTIVADKIMDTFPSYLKELPEIASEFKFVYKDQNGFVFSKQLYENTEDLVPVSLKEIQTAKNLGLNLQYEEIELGFTITSEFIDEALALGAKYFYFETYQFLASKKPPQEEKLHRPIDLYMFREANDVLKNYNIPLLNTTTEISPSFLDIYEQELKEFSPKYAYCDNHQNWILSKIPLEQETHESTLSCEDVYQLEKLAKLIEMGVSEVYYDKIEIQDTQRGYWLATPERFEKINSVLNIKYAYIDPETNHICFSKSKPNEYVKEVLISDADRSHTFKSLCIFGEQFVMVDKLTFESGLVKSNFELPYLYQDANTKNWILTKQRPSESEYLEDIVLPGHFSLGKSNNLTLLCNKITFTNYGTYILGDKFLSNMKYMYADAQNSQLVLSVQKPQPQSISNSLVLNMFYRPTINVSSFKGENLIENLVADQTDAQITGLDYDYSYMQTNTRRKIVYSNTKPDLNDCKKTMYFDGGTLASPLTTFTGEYLCDNIEFNLINTADESSPSIDPAMFGFKYLYPSTEESARVGEVIVSKNKPNQYESILDLRNDNDNDYDNNKESSFSFTGESLIKTVIGNDNYSVKTMDTISKQLGLKYLSFHPGMESFVYSNEHPQEQDIQRTFTPQSISWFKKLNFSGDVLIDMLRFDGDNQITDNFEGYLEILKKLNLKHMYLKKDGSECLVVKEQNKKLNKSYIMFDAQSELSNKILQNKNYRENYLKVTQLRDNKKIKFIPKDYVLEVFPSNQIENFFINNNHIAYGKLISAMGLDSLNDELYKVNALRDFLKVYYAIGGFSPIESERANASNYFEKFLIDNNISVKQGKKLVPSGQVNIQELASGIHRRFDGIQLAGPYNSTFAKFFTKYFHENPDFMNLSLEDENGQTLRERDYLCQVHNMFPEILAEHPNMLVNTTSRALKLTPEFVAKASRIFGYENIKPNNLHLAKLVAQHGYSQAQFEKMQDIFEKAKSRKEDYVIVADKANEENCVRYRFLEKDDPLGFIIGDLTGCCQHLGGAGETCTIDGFLNPNSGFLVFEEKLFDENNQPTGHYRLLGQAYIWYNKEKKTVCLDNIEIPDSVHKELEKADDALDKMSYATLMKALHESAEAVMHAMNQENVMVEKITVGTGFNDLNKQLRATYGQPSSDNIAKAPQGVYSDAKSQYTILTYDQYTKNQAEKIKENLAEAQTTLHEIANHHTFENGREN